MKQLTKLILLAMTGTSLNIENSFAVTDTLRYYDKVSAQQGYSFSSASYPEQFAVFQLPAPGFIKSIIVTLGGTVSSGSVILNLYGNEGGERMPQLLQKLMDSVLVKKTAAGIQRIQIDLKTSVWIDNNYF